MSPRWSRPIPAISWCYRVPAGARAGGIRQERVFRGLAADVEIGAEGLRGL